MHRSCTLPHPRVLHSAYSELVQLLRLHCSCVPSALPRVQVFKAGCGCSESQIALFLNPFPTHESWGILNSLTLSDCILLVPTLPCSSSGLQSIIRVLATSRLRFPGCMALAFDWWVIRMSSEMSWKPFSVSSESGLLTQHKPCAPSTDQKQFGEFTKMFLGRWQGRQPLDNVLVLPL